MWKLRNFDSAGNQTVVLIISIERYAPDSDFVPQGPLGSRGCHRRGLKLQDVTRRYQLMALPLILQEAMAALPGCCWGRTSSHRCLDVQGSMRQQGAAPRRQAALPLLFANALLHTAGRLELVKSFPSGSYVTHRPRQRRLRRFEMTSLDSSSGQSVLPSPAAWPGCPTRYLGGGQRPDSEDLITPP